MSLLTQVANKIKYMISQFVSDPEADAYARQQADQAAQDADTKKRIDEAKAQADADAKVKADTDAAAAELEERSQFKSKRAATSIASGVLKGFFSLFLFMFLLYGGHLAANQAIGYRVPFRLFMFIIGFLLSFYYIPKSLFDRYYTKIKPPYYSFLPISTYQPVGILQDIFLGGFCYTEDDNSRAARAAVESLYLTGFNKSKVE